MVPVWDLTATFSDDEEDNSGLRFIIKLVSIWLLVSSISAIIMMYGIWNVRLQP